MTREYTQTLRLIVEDTLTATARRNLEILDALAAAVGYTPGGGLTVSRSQVAAGTADHVLINDGDGALSSEAQLAVTRGGTGAGTAPAARAALGLEIGADVQAFSSKLAALAALADGTSGQVLSTNGAGAYAWASALVDPLTTRGDILYRDSSNVTSRLAVGAAGTVLKGGTDPSWGAVVDADIDAAAAIALSKLAALTAARAMVTDASGVASASSVTATELGHLSGVGSAIQTQLDARLPKAGGTMTGDLVLAGNPDAALKAAPKQYVDSGDSSVGSTAAAALSVHDSASSSVHGVGGDIVGTSDAQVLTSKKFDDELHMKQISTPSNPASGYSKVYPKSDGLLYKLDSSGNEVLVGSGSGAGEINIVVNPDGDTALDGSRTNDVGDWIDSGTGTTSTRTTTAAEIPLYPIKTNAILITNDGSGTGYTRLRMTLPPSLQGRRLKISCEQIVSTSTAYATGDYKLELYSNASSNYGGAYTAIALSTDVSSVTSIPAQNGKFQTSFDSTSAAYLELRITRVAGSSGSWIALNAVTVGPGIQAQGGVVTGWTTFTPSWTNGPTMSNNTGRWRQVGDSMEIEVAFTASAGGSGGALTLTVPNSLNINTAAVAGSTTQVSALGVGAWFDSDLNDALVLMSSYVSATSIGVLYNSTTYDTLDGADIGSSDQIGFRATIPILEWAGSGTMSVMQDETLTEWVSFTPVLSASGGGGISIGTGGNAASAAKWRRVGCNMEIQFAWRWGSSGTSFGTSGYYYLPLPTGYTIDSTSLVSSSTSTGVLLGGGHYYDSSAADFFPINAYYKSAAARIAFPLITSLTGQELGVAAPVTIANDDEITVSFSIPIAEWKGKSNGAIGFGLVGQSASGLVKGAGQLLGTNTNDSAATGYVGEYVESLITTNTSWPAASATYTDATSITLTAGDWDVTAVLMQIRNGATITYVEIGIGTASGTGTTGMTYGINYLPGTVGTSSSDGTSIVPVYRMSLSGTTTVYLKCRSSYSAAIPQYRCSLSARRVR